MIFKNRDDAAGRLAEVLAPWLGTNPLVLAIPRGAVPMAARIAEALDGDLDVVLVHKIGAPGDPEHAIGSVSEAGQVFPGPEALRGGADLDHVEREVAVQRKLMAARRKRYTPACPPIPTRGRNVIVVDDGLATGFTMIAALRTLRAHRPARLVAAVAVAPPDTLDRVRSLADDVVCLESPEPFFAVGRFFVDFSEVSDAEVVRVLKEFRTGRARRAAG